jgi:hypothetical protein
MTALTTPFSSQNTTIEIFNDSAATATLTAAIASALALSTTALKQDALLTAYTAFFGGSTLTASIPTTIGTVTSAMLVDGYFEGTFTYGSGSTLQKGTFRSTSATTSAITATFTLSEVGSGGAVSFVPVLTFTKNDATKGTVTTMSAIDFTGTPGDKIGKITAAGDTGKTYAGISAKLLNESGTMKAKGSSDEGDFTIDFLNTPGDPGQLAMTTAFNDESANANRVFRIIHGSSNDGTITNGEMVYFVGMVTELKKTRGAIDNYVSVKSKISIQNGLYEYNPS